MRTVTGRRWMFEVPGRAEIADYMKRTLRLQSEKQELVLI